MTKCYHISNQIQVMTTLPTMILTTLHTMIHCPQQRQREARESEMGVILLLLIMIIVRTNQHHRCCYHNEQQGSNADKSKSISTLSSLFTKDDGKEQYSNANKSPSTSLSLL